jgi:hypothetical protein
MLEENNDETKTSGEAGEGQLGERLLGLWREATQFGAKDGA